MGARGLRKASALAILNANYMAQRLKDYYPVSLNYICVNYLNIHFNCFYLICSMKIKCKQKTH